MKKYFIADCKTVLDAIYEANEDSSLSLINQLQIKIHLFFCPACNMELKKFRHFEDVMKDDFFPRSPEFEESFMEHLYKETGIEEKPVALTGFSFRSWVIIGFFMLLSLSSSFFGMNFSYIAASEGLSFLLPVGLTIGMLVTCYGALFIGSHLKELSSRFGLH